MAEALPLQITSLCKSYEKIEAVKSVSFSVTPGEIFGLLGPNGAGKTSIISILDTLESPTSGKACVFGHDVTDPKGGAKSMLGVVPQETVSHGFFTVDEVLRFHSGYYGIRHNEQQIRFLLGELGLNEHKDKRVRQLSGGMKRRLLIAKALVHKPKLLLLDEPTAGVDIELRASLWKFVRALNKEGVSILLTTHYLEEAESLCHRVGIIHHGQLLRCGNTAELVKQLTSREITIYIENAGALENLPHLVSKKKGELLFRVSNDFHLADLLTKLPLDQIKDIRIREGNLEDAFLNLVEERPS